jgi:hypothetical protein
VGSATLLWGRLRRCHTGRRHGRYGCADIAVYRRLLVLVHFVQDSRLLGLLPIVRPVRTICLEARVQSDRPLARNLAHRFSDRRSSSLACHQPPEAMDSKIPPTVLALADEVIE